MKQLPKWITWRRGARRVFPRLAVIIAAASLMLSAPTPANAAFQPVDLTSSAGTRGAGGSHWSMLPTGGLTNAGVPFLLGGPIAVTGLDAARRGDFFSSRVDGIALGRKTARLHVLHGVDQSDRDGVPLVELILHYANGERRALRLAYGLHARSLVREKRERKSALLDPNSSQIGGENDQGRLFHTALDNPLPGQEIKAVDWVSIFSRATPLMLALTVEQGTPAPLAPLDTSRKVVKRALDSDASDFRDVLAIRPMASTGGQLLAGATAALSIADDRGPFYFGEVKADADGVLRLPYPPQQALNFHVLVRAPGHVPAVVRGSKTDPRGFRGQLFAKLEPGVRVGGLVKSEDGKPVSGVKVVAARIEKNSPQQYTRTDCETVFTDTNGQWSCSSMPAEVAEFSFDFSHPEYRAATFSPGRLAEPDLIAAAREKLLAGQSEWVLEPAIRVLVIARDDTGQPVAGAEVRVQNQQNGVILPSVRTDAKGRASFMVPDPVHLAVAVFAPGFAPRQTGLMVRPLPGTNSVPGSNPSANINSSFRQELSFRTPYGRRGGSFLWPQNVVAMTLSKARMFQARVVDQYQQPVPGARVRLDGWNNTRLLQWQALSDSNGVVTWNSAPDGYLNFSVSAADHATLTSSLSGTSTEHIFSIQKTPRVRGWVVDAETKKPLQEFSIIRGHVNNPGEPPRWERYNAVRGRNGEYAMRLEYFVADRMQIMVEAPGYLPQASRMVLRNGLGTNDFELKKGKGPSGIVEMPDGRPVVGATMALVDAAEYSYMDRPGELRRVNNYGDHVRTDATGYFEFQPRLDPHTVLASAPSGFAEIRAADLLKAGKMVLQPWGRIKGVVRVEQLDPNAVVRLQNPDFQQGDGGRTVAPVYLYLKTDLDEDGAFIFDRVPPGERKVQLEFKLNERKNGRVASSHGRQVTVRPGETTVVNIGGEGRRLIGRVESSTGDSRDVDWRRDNQMLHMNMRHGPSYPQMSNGFGVTEEDRRRNMAEHDRRVAEYWRSPEGLALRHAHRSYSLRFETNGVFHVDGVEPGQYQLNMQFTDRAGGDNNYSSIGSHYMSVTVPPGPNGKPGEPFDLGTIKVQIRPTGRGRGPFPDAPPQPDERVE